MTTLTALIRKANKQAKALGHTPGKWSKWGVLSPAAETYCQQCGGYILVSTFENARNLQIRSDCFDHKCVPTKSRLLSLKREAGQSTRNAGHTLGKWTTTIDKYGQGFAQATCTRCGEWVEVKTHPMPNDIEIAGSVFGTSCSTSCK